MPSIYTDQFILDDAAKYNTKRDWRRASYALYKAATNRGPEFYARCQAHMQKRVCTGTSGMKGKFRYPDAEIEAAAKLYTQRNHFKRGPHGHLYRAALLRSGGCFSEFFIRITAHMDAPSNPYRGSVYAYVCEFADRHAYVGLSATKEGNRWAGHMRPDSPVKKHIDAHHGVPYEFKVLERGINVATRRAKENFWKDTYIDNDWTPLWDVKNPDGSLGSIPTVTKEQCAVCANQCATLGEFFRLYQSRYRIAKKHGWFEEITSHMPRDLSQKAGMRNIESVNERPISEETRAKMSEAKVGRTLSPEHRAKLAAANRARANDPVAIAKRLATIAAKPNAYSWIKRGLPSVPPAASQSPSVSTA